jgi:predicted O-linked N-acetylglucosamine transferase (SPINDLY family)
MGASILGAMGLDRLVAQDADEYVRIASELAATQLSPLRASLRARMAASPVCDAVRTTRDLERAYLLMIERHERSDG